MAQPELSTVLQDKTVYIPFGDFIKSLTCGLLAFALAVGGSVLPLFVTEPWAAIVGWGGAGLMLIGLLFLPVGVALDIGDRIPEIRAAREKDKSLKELNVHHPYLWVIILLNITTFWSGVGWFVALIWACSPGKVVIPDKLFNVVFANNDQSESKVRSDNVTSTPSETPKLEAELEEIKQLVDKGLITKEEAEIRRKFILNR